MKGQPAALLIADNGVFPVGSGNLPRSQQQLYHPRPLPSRLRETWAGAGAAVARHGRRWSRSRE